MTGFNTVVLTPAGGPPDHWPREVEIYAADPFPTMRGWRLAALPDETVLLPGHNYGGASSTVGDEKRQNRFLRFRSLGEFLAVMGGGRIILP